MATQFSFFASIVFSFVAWGIVMSGYVWPRLRVRSRSEALRPLLVLHSFRFVGLAFLVPGVVAPDLPAAFARSAAYGDLIAAVLALLALLTQSRGSGVLVAWVFNLWGTADILAAFYQANSTSLVPGQLGATYFIPTFVVPLLLITHAVVFRILWRSREVRNAQQLREPHKGREPLKVRRSGAVS